MTNFPRGTLRKSGRLHFGRLVLGLLPSDLRCPKRPSLPKWIQQQEGPFLRRKLDICYSYFSIQRRFLGVTIVYPLYPKRAIVWSRRNQYRRKCWLRISTQRKYIFTNADNFRDFAGRVFGTRSAMKVILWLFVYGRLKIVMYSANFFKVTNSLSEIKAYWWLHI